MNLSIGLYEKLINQFLDKHLLNLDEQIYLINRDDLDASTSNIVLSKYLQTVLEKTLQYFSKEDQIPNQIELCNKIIELIKMHTNESSVDDFLIKSEPEILLSIFERKMKAIKASIIRPVSSLSTSILFTGSKIEPSLASEIKKEIISSDHIDIIVSFIRWSGIRILADELIQFTKMGHLRVISTSYLGVTEQKAIDFLYNLPNTEIKMSYDAKQSRLHAKAFLFYRYTGYNTAYIGSSNISNVAMTSGMEWNVKATSQDAPQIIEKFTGTFESYWNDKDFITYDETQRDILRQALMSEGKESKDAPSYLFDINPYPFQAEILESLEAEREIHGHFRNLVVAATGTGKTVISAFDYKRYCSENTNKTNRLLFIAHREEILKQSIYCFRQILRDHNFGELFVGNFKPTQSDHLFMSIQSINSRDVIDSITPDYYDFVIIDEFHHAAAPSYIKVLKHLQPKILLGLTATPERMDGEDIFQYFDYRIAAELRLPEAINRKLLCPFQYFGVTDNVDLNDIHWQRGGYDLQELENVYTGNDLRSDNIIKSLNKYLNDPLQVKGLGFCVGVRHAEYMASYFNKAGIPSDFLTGNSNDEIRNTIQNRLLKGDIKFIFVVDLYNEGVDIPQIDTVLFLRPTQSITVFLQQLGRGLRNSENKECLTVFDFIGQAHEKYDYEGKYRALLGTSHYSVKQEVEKGFPHLPSGCIIQLEKVAKDYILKNIEKSYTQNISGLLSRIKSFQEDTGLVLNLQNFIEHYKISLNYLYSKKSSWSRLLVKAGMKNDFNEPDEKQLTTGMCRLVYSNSRRIIDFWLRALDNEDLWKDNITTNDEYKILLMFHYNLWSKSGDELSMNNIYDSYFRLKENPVMLQEVKELLKYRFESIHFIDKHIPLSFDCPLDLHCNYNRDEILAAMGASTFTKERELREGVCYLVEQNIDLLFVTLNKSDKDYSESTLYDDYAVSDTLFHWQSQSTTSENSNTGQRYINHENTGHRILLFVREYKREFGITNPYTYLGPIKYVSHKGSRPMNIIWKLDYPIPAHLYNDTHKLSVG